MKILLSGVRYAFIDTADWPLIQGYSWHAHRTPTGKWYARTSVIIKGRKKWLWMHRLILGLSHGRIADHIDGNGLNNRRMNLRPSTYSNNARNMRVRKHSSRWKGVTWRKNRRKWLAQIELGNRKNVYLGCFNTQEEAAMAYDRAARLYFGEHAHVNARA